MCATRSASLVLHYLGMLVGTICMWQYFNIMVFDTEKFKDVNYVSTY